MKRLLDWPHDCLYSSGCNYQHRNEAGIVECHSPGGPCDYLNEISEEDDAD